MASSFEFAREWGGELQSIEFASPKPLLPSKSTTFLYYAGIPKRFELATYQQVRFDFLSVATSLPSIWEHEMPEYSLPVQWAGLWRFGDITYTQAKSWLCMEEVSGRIVAIDVEIDNPLYVVNTSIDAMMRCMKLLRDWVRSTDGELAQRAQFTELISKYPDLDEGEANYFWLPLIEEAAEPGCEKVDLKYE